MYHVLPAFNFYNHVLTLSILKFIFELYIQSIGTAMGIKSCSNNGKHFHVRDWWKGKSFYWLQNFVSFLPRACAIFGRNKFGTKTIKFTSEFDFVTKSPTFLDFEGKISKDLYRNKTDCARYLLPSSCHSVHIFKNAPYSLAIHLVRICSDPLQLQKKIDWTKWFAFTMKIHYYNSY